MIKQPLRTGPLTRFDYEHPSPGRLRDLGCVVGIDVSHHQESVDWSKVSEDVTFASCRVAYGKKVDTRFHKYWPAATKSLKYVGAYQYVLGTQPVVEQAHMFCDVLQSVAPCTLPPMLDAEHQHKDSGENLLSFDDAILWCNIVEERTGIVPIIYTTPYYWSESEVGATCRYPLWVSHVETSQPKVPKPWETWLIWQMSWTGRVPGISTNVDIDVYDGSLDQFDAVVKLLMDSEFYSAMTRGNP